LRCVKKIIYTHSRGSFFYPQQNERVIQMIDINLSLFIQLINILLLMWILNILLYKPIRTILRQRAEKKGLLTSECLTAEENLVRKKNEVQEQLQQARKAGMDQKNLLKLDAQEEEKKLLQEANQKVEGELTQARSKIVQQLEAARKSLTGDVAAFSQEIAQKILGRTI
jgi:F-type H+-transporting ATPase subunit b